MVGSTIYNTVVAITNSATLSSLYGWGRYGGLQQTASFNFTDLYVSPVPQSIYASQPRCASSTNSIQYSCLRFGTTGGPLCASALGGDFVCATSLPYEPVLAIPAEVKGLQPGWASCLGGLAGVYEFVLSCTSQCDMTNETNSPPSALHAAVSAAAITMPKGSTAAHTTTAEQVSPTTQASPSPTVSSAAPSTQAPSPSDPASPTQSKQADPTIATSSSVVINDGNSFPAPSSHSNAQPPSSNALDVLTQAQSEAAPEASFDSTPEGITPIPAQSTADVAADPTAGVSSIKQAPEESASGSLQQLSDTTDATNPSDAVSQALSMISNAESHAQAAPTANDPQNTIVGIGSHVVIINPSATTVLQAGSTAIIGSQTFAANTDGVDVDGSSASFFTSIAATQQAPANSPAAVWTTGTQEISAHLESSGIVLQAPDATTTIAQGSLATFAGQTISADTSAQAIHVDGSSIPLSSPQLSPTDEHFSYSPQSTDSSAITALAFPSASATLTPGSAITLSGTIYSLPTNPTGDIIYIDGKSSSMHIPSAQGEPSTFSQGLLASPAGTEPASLPAFISPSGNSNETSGSTSISTATSTAERSSSTPSTGAPSQTPGTSGAGGKSNSLFDALSGLITVSLLLWIA